MAESCSQQKESGQRRGNGPFFSLDALVRSLILFGHSTNGRMSYIEIDRCAMWAIEDNVWPTDFVRCPCRYAYVLQQFAHPHSHTLLSGIINAVSPYHTALHRTFLHTAYGRKFFPWCRHKKKVKWTIAFNADTIYSNRMFRSKFMMTYKRYELWLRFSRSTEWNDKQRAKHSNVSR